MGDPQVFVRIRERFGGLTPRVIGYVALVDAVAIAAVAALIITGHDLGNELAVAGLAVVASWASEVVSRYVDT